MINSTCKLLVLVYHVEAVQGQTAWLGHHSPDCSASEPTWSEDTAALSGMISLFLVFQSSGWSDLLEIWKDMILHTLLSFLGTKPWHRHSWSLRKKVSTGRCVEGFGCASGRLGECRCSRNSCLMCVLYTCHDLYHWRKKKYIYISGHQTGVGFRRTPPVGVYNFIKKKCLSGT